jgi:hypothetical protein
LEY